VLVIKCSLVIRGPGLLAQLRGQLLGRCKALHTLGRLSSVQIPGVHIECLQNPILYSVVQIEEACRIAARLNRGKFCLVESPERDDG
jgi:hypothetical protein